MAYLQARSGIARSGVTYTGWTPPSVKGYIGGTDRTDAILREGWTLSGRAGSPATFRFRTKTITPVVGQDVKVAYATPNDYLFGGTILQREAAPESPDSDVLVWDCTAVGYQWLLDRYDRVLAQYQSTGVGTMVADILYRFTDGGFRVGYCPASLGNLDMTFTFETVWQALQRIAKAKGAVVRVTPERIVDLYVSYPEAALATVTEATIRARSLTYREDLTQVRTRTLYEGQGSSAAAAVSAGASTVPVSDVGPFIATGGSAVSGCNLFTYAAVSAGSGAGSLTGCSGILYDIAADDAVNLIVDVDDAPDTAALATILGGGLSGQATNYLQDGRLSATESTDRAAADLETFGGALDDVSFTYKTPQRYVRAGKAVTMNVANPLSVTGEYTIQAVTLTPYGAVGGANFEVNQQVDLGSFSRSITDLLRQLRG